ncbi:MAG: hypothetical protein ACPGVD_09420, partial [Flavobacteriales bacterium]
KVAENKVEISAVKPPIEGLEVNKNTFTIEPNQESVFKTSKGSEVIIPANSVVYADGSEVTEKVEIQFSEFHNMAEIALSGIPMVYYDNGVATNFISGGMFDIKGKAVSGKEVKVKEGENLTINLASNKEGEFDLFSLNETTGEWTILNQEIIQSSIDTAPSLPAVPEKPSENDVILDLNISKFNGTYSFESNMWKVLGNISDNKKKRIRETDWTKYEIETIDEKGLIYSVKLSKKKEELIVQATPVLSPSDRDKCKEGVANEIKSMQKDLASNFYKPRVVRRVNIGGFGTVNCDVFVVTDQNLTCDLKVEGVKTEEIDFVQFDYTQDMMVRVSNGNLQFKPESKNLLVGLLPDDKIAVFTPDQYESLKKMEKGSTVEVELKKMDVTIGSANDLQEIIMSYL